MLYVTGAKGKDGVVNIYDTAKVEVHDPYDDNFYDIDTDHLVYVTYRSPAKPTDAWLNFSEEYDRDYETITFSKKTTADASDSKEDTDADEDTDKDTAETPESVTTQTHTYTIRIGNTMIAKDGAPAYQGDVPAYLSEAGYTMLPLRALLSVSQEDVDIDWNQAEKTATIQWGDTTAVIQENNRTMVVNGKTVALINPRLRCIQRLQRLWNISNTNTLICHFDIQFFRIICAIQLYGSAFSLISMYDRIGYRF